MIKNKLVGILNSSKRNFSVGVYMWAKIPRLGTKSGNLKNQLEMPKGVPKRVTEFDALNVKQLKIGLRHSAVITEEGDLYTFGNGNWGVLGHGNEDAIRFNKPKIVEGLKKAGVKVKDC
jgi:alpha-tubulin suppressor-like RCC1 family protein